MDQALVRTDHVGARPADARVAVARHPVAAHAGGQVDHHVRIAVAHPLDRLAEQLGIAAALAGLRVAHVQMGDRRARPGGLDRRVCHLFRRHGHARVLVQSIAGAGHGACDDNLVVHGSRLPARGFLSRILRTHGGGR